jgi:choline dehydrogenase-like flavoprotein
MADDPVIVIGSGPCGAAAAARLTRRGVPVLLLDAGLRAPTGLLVRAAGHTIVRRKGWAEYSEGRQDPASTPDVEWYSSLSLGGLSNYWTGAVPRFAPEDFTEGGRIDQRYVWPLTYDELEPYYREMEAVLVVTAGAGPIRNVPSNIHRYTQRLPAAWEAIAGRANERGHGVGPIPLAKGRPWMIARRGTEFGSYHCMVDPLRSSSTFRLVTGAQVTRLVWSASTGRVEEIEYIDRHRGEPAVARGRAVVLAAGAIDSTAILLRSRSADFPRGLGNERGLVGRYLHDHPREWWVVKTADPLPSLAHPIYFARTSYEASDPLMATSLTLGQTPSVADRVKSFYGGRTKAFGVQVFGTMVPTPDVGVHLSEQGDDHAAPAITLRYDGPTVTNLLGARQRLKDTLREAGHDVEIPGPFHALKPGSSVHFGGSVRMHASAEFGVVDGWNRVHDAPDVVVCDTSCFTTAAEKNPVLTAMSIATRAADHLADQLSGRPA